jgi:hypothetical protein
MDIAFAQINNEMHGTGCAYFDASALPCLDTLFQRRAKMHVDAWQSPDVQSSMVELVVSELKNVLPKRAVVRRPDILRHWDGFLDALGVCGGAVQAVPPAVVSVTSPPPTNTLYTPCLRRWSAFVRVGVFCCYIIFLHPAVLHVFVRFVFSYPVNWPVTIVRTHLSNSFVEDPSLGSCVLTPPSARALRCAVWKCDRSFVHLA